MFIVFEGEFAIGSMGNSMNNFLWKVKNIVDLVVVILKIVLSDFLEGKGGLVVVHKLFDLTPIAIAPIFNSCGKDDFIHEIP